MILVSFYLNFYTKSEHDCLITILLQAFYPTKRKKNNSYYTPSHERLYRRMTYNRCTKGHKDTWGSNCFSFV